MIKLAWLGTLILSVFAFALVASPSAALAQTSTNGSGVLGQTGNGTLGATTTGTGTTGTMGGTTTGGTTGTTGGTGSVGLPQTGAGGTATESWAWVASALLLLALVPVMIWNSRRTV